MFVFLAVFVFNQRTTTQKSFSRIIIRL